MQLSNQNDQEHNYESNCVDSMLSCNINTDYNSLKNTWNVKFKNDHIESAKHTNKSVDEIINKQENISEYNKYLLKNELKYFDALFHLSLGTCKHNSVISQLKTNAILKYHKLFPVILKYYDKVK